MFLFQTNVHIQYTNVYNTYYNNKTKEEKNVKINTILISTIVGLESA